MRRLTEETRAVLSCMMDVPNREGQDLRISLGTTDNYFGGSAIARFRYYWTL